MWIEIAFAIALMVIIVVGAYLVVRLGHSTDE